MFIYNSDYCSHNKFNFPSRYATLIIRVSSPENLNPDTVKILQLILWLEILDLRFIFNSPRNSSE